MVWASLVARTPISWAGLRKTEHQQLQIADDDGFVLDAVPFNLELEVGPLGVVCECHGPHSWPLVHSKPEPLEPVLDSRALHEVRGWHYGAAWRGVAIDAALSPSPVEVTRNSMPRLPTTLGNDCHRWRGPPCSLMGYVAAAALRLRRLRIRHRWLEAPSAWSPSFGRSGISSDAHCAFDAPLIRPSRSDGRDGTRELLPETRDARWSRWEPRVGLWEILPRPEEPR